MGQQEHWVEQAYSVGCLPKNTGEESMIVSPRNVLEHRESVDQLFSHRVSVIPDLCFAYALLYLSHPWMLDKKLRYLQNDRIMLSVHTVSKNHITFSVKSSIIQWVQGGDKTVKQIDQHVHFLERNLISLLACFQGISC